MSPHDPQAPKLDCWLIYFYSKPPRLSLRPQTLHQKLVRLTSQTSAQNHPVPALHPLRSLILPPHPPSQPKLTRKSLQRPHLHNHHTAPSHRLLLPEKHRRAPARGVALVERSGHGDGRLALGLRVRRPGNPHHQRHRQALLLARAVCATGPMGHPRYCGAGQFRAHLVDPGW